MTIIYDKETKLVLAGLSSNCSDDVIPSSAILKMFPNSTGRVGSCQMDVGRSLGVIGTEVHFKSEIPFKLTKNNESIFLLDDEELERRIKKNAEIKRKKMLSNFPCKCSKGSVGGFLNRLIRLPHTYDEIASAMIDGSFFEKKVTPVGWWGSFTDAGGYANMNREIIRRLHNHHIIPYIRFYSTINQIDPPLYNLLNQYVDLSPKKGKHPFVYAYTPMAHDYHGGKRIFFTMMETASVHPVFVDYCNRYSDEIWVPSKANKNVFERAGIKKKTRVLPLGIDETLYLSGKVKVKSLDGMSGVFGKPPGKGVAKFKFVSVIQWNFRKGYDAIIKSFVNAFDASDDVCLVFVTQYSRETVISDLKPYLPREDNLPQVLLYNKIVPTIEMPGLYRNFDCYLHLSRGEGFSLTQIEAAACGLPVISNYHSGMTEYLTEQNSFIIDCDETEKCCQKLAGVCFFYQSQYLWKVGKKQVDAAVDYMRYVHENYDAAKKRAAILRSDVVSRYTWKKTAERVANNLRA